MILDVSVAGERYIDLILGGFDDVPRPGREAVTNACGLARLGTRTGLPAIAGADYDTWIAARREEFGVEAAAVALDPVESTGFTVAVTSPEDATFFTQLGANRKFTAVIMPAPFDGARHVLRAVDFFFPDETEAARLHRVSPANICGALSTGACGGVAGFPSRERVLQELSS